MIAPKAGLSVSRQCALLGIARGSFYYRPRPESAEQLELLKRLDRIFTRHPVYGSRRLQVALLREGISVGRRRLAAPRKQLAGPLHQLLFPVADHRRMNPKLHRQLRQNLLP